MEREDWMHVGMVVSGAALGLAARVFFKSKCMKKAAVGATAAALRIQNCAEKSAACLNAQADDIVAQAKEENRKREEAELAEMKAKEDALTPVEDKA